MELLHQTEVTADQIDHLGHMNVSFYGRHARRGADHLLAGFGLPGSAEQVVVARDLYVRHHHEQLLGSPLEVRGGVLDASADGIRLYEELTNGDTGQLAATFVSVFGLAESASRTSLPLDPSVVAAAEAQPVTVPEAGRWRSISYEDDPVAGAPSLEVLVERGLAMRQARVLEASSTKVDVQGYASTSGTGELMWGGQPVASDDGFGPLQPLPGGGQLGFATMETRSSWVRSPRLGDRVQSFAAPLVLAAKTMLTRHWLYDTERAELLLVLTTVSLGFDLDARRSAPIPEAMRTRIESRLQPDLAGVPIAEPG